jgi:hypothetical protein
MRAIASGIGNPLAGFLLGHHVIKPGLQVISYRRYGVLGIEERKGVLDLAAVGAQLVRGHCRQGVFRLVYSRRWAWDYGG